MTYRKILKTIAKKNNTTVDNVEKEMMETLAMANIKCSPKDFIFTVSAIILQKTNNGL